MLPPVVWFADQDVFLHLLFYSAAGVAAAAALRSAMSWGWKVMLPLALVNMLVTGAVVLALSRE